MSKNSHEHDLLINVLRGFVIDLMHGKYADVEFTIEQDAAQDRPRFYRIKIDALLYTYDEKQALMYDPFQGDESEVIRSSDKFVTTRTVHTCQHCRMQIKPRSRCRCLSEINREEHKRMSFYFCPACCEAMAKIPEDAGAALDQRSAYRMNLERGGTP